MESTPLHHKPVSYGSHTADLIFVLVVLLHLLPGLVALISSIVALASQKGRRVHIAAGKVFVASMLVVAVTGIGIDLVRLLFEYRPNHTKYATTSDPSTIPARLGFLYAGLCVLWLLSVAAPRKVWRRRGAAPPGPLFPALLAIIAIVLATIIVVRYNPWTGSLAMIATCALAVLMVARAPGGVPQHRVGMVALGVFSWWGALQGFIPGIVYAIRGIDRSTTPYVGDQPGHFTPGFIGIAIGWVVIGTIAALVIRRFRRRAHARGTLAEEATAPPPPSQAA